jgi:hypothetical protein
MSILLDIDARSRQSLDLPAEGLLGLRPRPFGVASGLRPTAFNLGCAQVVEPGLFYVGGSTDTHIDTESLPIIFCKKMPAEGLLGAARLARSLRSGPPSKTPAFNFA